MLKPNLRTENTPAHKQIKEVTIADTYESETESETSKQLAQADQYAQPLDSGLPGVSLGDSEETLLWQKPSLGENTQMFNTPVGQLRNKRVISKPSDRLLGKTSVQNQSNEAFLTEMRQAGSPSRHTTEQLQNNRLQFLRRLTIERQIRDLNVQHVQKMGKAETFVLTSDDDDTNSIVTESDIEEEEEASVDGDMHDTKANHLMLTSNIRSTLKDLKVLMKGNKGKKRHQTADFSGTKRLDTSLIEEQNRLLKETFESNQVIVFPTEFMKPWDNVARLNFLECNLKNVVQEGVPYQKTKKTFKDPFVGAINQLKTKKPSTPEKQTQFPEIISQNKSMTEQKKRKKEGKPMNEKAMKGAIDLYAQINDTTFAKHQEKIPNSNSVGLTKAQRTRQAVKKDKVDPNKNSYLETLRTVTEQSNEVNVMNIKSLARHMRKVDMWDKQLNETKKTVKEAEMSKKDKVEQAFGKMMQDEDNELSVAALSLIKKKESSTYTPLDLMANIMRSRIKDQIFNEQVHTHKQLVRQKLHYEIIKDNARNGKTKQILDLYARDEDKKFHSTDYKYHRLQQILDRKAKVGWEKSEIKKLQTLRAKELSKTKSEKKQAQINKKYDMLEEDIREQSQRAMAEKQNTRKMQAVGTNDGAMKELISHQNKKSMSRVSSQPGSGVNTPHEAKMDQMTAQAVDQFFYNEEKHLTGLKKRH